MTVFCTYCGQKFSRAEHLDRHVLTHTNLKPFKCSTCHFSFKRRDLLQRHYTLIHKQQTESTSIYQQKEAEGQRRPIACTLCAKAKTKCDKAIPSCSRCTSKGLICEPRLTNRQREAVYQEAMDELNHHHRSDGTIERHSQIAHRNQHGVPEFPQQQQQSQKSATWPIPTSASSFLSPSTASYAGSLQHGLSSDSSIPIPAPHPRTFRHASGAASGSFDSLPLPADLTRTSTSPTMHSPAPSSTTTSTTWSSSTTMTEPFVDFSTSSSLGSGNEFIVASMSLDVDPIFPTFTATTTATGADQVVYASGLGLSWSSDAAGLELGFGEVGMGMGLEGSWGSWGSWGGGGVHDAVMSDFWVGDDGNGIV
ncbi:hypothetical protein K402DRAFT_416076 [Aulographum hederae CBS 113979]|uniref:Zn(2)-C6 fungal-type domain-containing protein n=1 Tax=Aulographum hederae CBS 113979 TaxID=1176131 RepID=A0A6G1HHA8_9PEZI|nr:hypothetical protein K402DRAFT_416076 [Aulographum hederae CBS 113979]